MSDTEPTAEQVAMRAIQKMLREAHLPSVPLKAGILAEGLCLKELLCVAEAAARVRYCTNANSYKPAECACPGCQLDRYVSDLRRARERTR